jgi:Uma2 family endonuclease
MPEEGPMATVTEPLIETPEIGSDLSDSLYEVVNGQILEKKSGVLQIRIAGLLLRCLDAHVRPHRLGSTDMEMLFLLDRSAKLMRRPDVSFVSRDRWPIDELAPDTEAWDVIPDLAVEVISKSNAATDVKDKIDEYFKAGVRLIWLVYPKQKVVDVYESPTTVRVLRREDELSGGDVLPGFRLPLTSLFKADPA